MPGSGGAAISTYTAYVAGTNTVLGTGSAIPFAITGLTNGTAVSIEVTATNTAGESARSAAVSVIPASGGVPFLVESFAGIAGASLSKLTATTGSSTWSNPTQYAPSANFAVNAAANDCYVNQKAPGNRNVAAEASWLF